MARGPWVYAGGRAGNKPSPATKSEITAACERLITEVLLPRYLPAVTPTEFNYPVAIYGKWHGNRYRFITRYRSDRPDSTEPEFEHAFARLDFVARDRFDLLFHRHTGEWLPLHQAVTLADAMRLISEGGYFEPC